MSSTPPPGTEAVVAEGLLWHTTVTQTVYDLDVANLDTYYVLAGDTPILVHNDDEEEVVEERGSREGAGRNDRHGDGGTRLTQAEQRIEELKAQIVPGMPRAERKKIEQKIKNIRRDAERAAAGTEHHRNKNPRC